MLRNLLFSTTVAGMALAMSGAAPALAQEEGVPTFGSGEDRVCNTVITTARESVLQTDTADPVTQLGTYDCPEVMAAVVEPAAPPQLPEGGEVYFPLNEWELTPEALSAVSTMVHDIQDRDLAATGIEVVGHTDTSCPPGDTQEACAAFNQQLSEKRAQSVAQELVAQGVPVQDISTEGVGMTDLADPTGPRVVNQANRRAQIRPHFDR